MDRVCAAPVQRIMAAKGLEEGQIIVDWLGNMTQVGFALHCTRWAGCSLHWAPRAALSQSAAGGPLCLSVWREQGRQGVCVCDIVCV